MSKNPVLMLALPAWLAATAALPAQADGTVSQDSAKAGRLHITYTISFWGIPFGQTNYTGRFADKSYSADSHFETSGIVSMFWQATIDAGAHGQMDAHAVTPAEYDSFFRRGESKKERVKVTFAGDDPAVFAEPPYDTTRFPVTAAQKREAMDPMSAVTLVLLGVKADPANPCGTVAPVFDGRRRYDIQFAYKRDEPLALGRVFTGKAHLCQLHYVQIAGFKPKILKEGAAFPPIFADFADIPSAGAPGGRYVVPLKLWSQTSWGTVTAELTELHPGADGPSTGDAK